MNLGLEHVGTALILTTLAGLSTGIGSAIAYFIKKPKMQYLSFSLGFSAGVMVYISFMELIPSAIKNVGELWGVIAFFIGIGFIGLIDIVIPKTEEIIANTSGSATEYESGYNLKGDSGCNIQIISFSIVIDFAIQCTKKPSTPYSCENGGTLRTIVNIITKNSA